jgi:hypothetical protein
MECFQILLTKKDGTNSIPIFHCSIIAYIPAIGITKQPTIRSAVARLNMNKLPT